jgi:outer membrane protein insertion porin family/translocation and assembly module TamA
MSRLPFRKFSARAGSVALLLAMPLTHGAAQDTRDQQERPEVRAFRIRGTHAVPKADLQLSLATKPSACKSLLLKPFCWITKSHYVYERRYLDRDEFERDVLRALVFYFRRGYRDARVDTTVARDGNGVRITFAVTEGPPTALTSSVIEASPALVPPLDSARLLRPQVGAPLNLLVVDSTVVRLRETLWERGFADAIVKPVTRVDSAANTADLRFLVDPKRRVTIGSIRIEGNERVATEDVRRSLRIAPGSLFRLSRVGRSQRALYESALFRRVVIDTLPRRAESDTVRDLVVRVQEAPLREARTSLGFTTADFGQVDGRFTHNYWLNGPRRLDLSLTVGNLLAQQLTRSSFFVNFTNIARDNALGRFYAPTWQASADVRQRWFGSPRNTISTGLFSHRRSSPGVFVDRGYGASATFTRELGIRIPASVNYRFEISRVEAGDVYFCVNYGVCDGSTIAALRGQQRLSPLAFTVSFDRSNAPLSPTKGVRFRTEAEHASAFTASDFRYNRAMADVAAYYPLSFRRSVAAAHLRLGWVKPLASTADAVGIPVGLDGLSASDILHPRKRFYAGGSQSVRGFGENQLGPRVLTIAPEKLRGRTVTGTDTSFACAPSVPIRQCDVNAAHLRDSDFQVRPLGGTTLVEASLEYRVRVWRQVVGAVFVDGALLGEGAFGSITKGTGAITPGFGVRYESPVGPIRIDLGIRPTLRQALPVITQDADSAGRATLVTVSSDRRCTETTQNCRVFPDPEKSLGLLRRITNRLTLHLSIGQAF